MGDGFGPQLPRVHLCDPSTDPRSVDRPGSPDPTPSSFPAPTLHSFRSQIGTRYLQSGSTILQVVLHGEARGVPSPPRLGEGRGRPPASREGPATAAVPPRSSRLSQAARLLFPVLTREAHALRPFPRPRREEKGSVVFLSSFPLLTGWLHTGSDSPDGNPTRLSRPLLQRPRPRLICLCPDRGKEEEEKPQTSFANQFAARAWSARRRLNRSGILKTPEAPGAPGCPQPVPRLPSPPTLLRRARGWP
ncbi:hypothetical protein ACRRTK_023045 [Alexandromys fortis]